MALLTSWHLPSLEALILDKSGLENEEFNALVSKVDWRSSLRTLSLRRNLITDISVVTTQEFISPSLNDDGHPMLDLNVLDVSVNPLDNKSKSIL